MEIKSRDDLFEKVLKRAMERDEEFNGDELDETIEKLLRDAIREYSPLLNDKIKKLEKTLNEDVNISIKRKNNKVIVKGEGNQLALAMLLEVTKNDMLKELGMPKETFEQLYNIIKREREEVNND